MNYPVVIFGIDGTETVLRTDCPDENIASALTDDAQRAYEMGYKDALGDIEQARVELIKRYNKQARS